MNIVSFNQVIELNHLIEKKDLPFKIHIRDSCGAQSFYIEELENNILIGTDKDLNAEKNKDVDVATDEDIYDTIEAYFKNNNMKVVYHENKHNFTIK